MSGILEDSDGRARYELLVPPDCEQKMFNSNLRRLRLLLLRRHHLQTLAKLVVDTILDGQIALGAYFGEHGPAVFGDHRAGKVVQCLEQNDGRLVGLRRVLLDGDVGAREVKEQVENAALVERAKELGDERSRDREVARNTAAAALVLGDDVAEGETSLVVKKVCAELGPPHV